jgi:predicted ATPase/DNA-binding SARP family transcriptional activator
VELRVLGPLVVIADDGTDVTPRGPQQRRLLAALVAAAPEILTVDTLVDLLWTDGAPSANALQAQVSKIRRLLGATTITGDRRGYALVPAAGDRVDVADFERLVDGAARSAAAGDDAAAADQYATALALVRGAPLHDVAETDAFRPAATRLAGLVSAARRGRADALLATGQVGHAVAELEGHLARTPLDEGAWAALMVGRARQGRQADALRTYQRARRILADELGIEPGPELRAVERQVLEQDPAVFAARTSRDAGAGAEVRHVAVGRIRRRLPARLSPLIGRDAVLDAIRTDLFEHRLVTLLGPGGAGKTSAATEVARSWDTGPAVLVELAPVGDPDSVAVEIAAAIGLTVSEGPVAGASTFDRLVDAIAGEQVLLVLDNCEHVVDTAAKLVHRLLEACEDLTLLATSREALSVPGERVVALPPLDEVDAVRLFVDRARAVAGVDVDVDDDEDVVAEICRRLDGLPLAIELAAARVRSMQPAEVLERLDDRFALLAGGGRTIEARQQTLRAVVDWSHDLLDDSERAVFRRLAAFSGGATMSAAEAVCADGDDVLVADVSGIVERLIDKSLVVVERAGGPARYTMLQTLHDYAAERLRESGEVERVLERHARYMDALLAPARHGLTGPEQQSWIELITIERENVRVALDVAVARGDADLALSLASSVGWYFYMVAQTDMGAQAMETALSCPGMADPVRRALVLAHYGWLAANGPNIDIAIDATQEAVSLTASFDDPWIETFVLTTRMMALFFGGRVAEVRELMPQLEAAARRSGDDWSRSLAAVVRGEIANYEGRPAAAESAFAEAICGFERHGDEFSVSLTLTEAAEIAESRGDYEHAVELLTRGMETSERVGFSGNPLGMRARLGNLEALRGNLDAAERLHRQLLDEIGDHPLPWLRAMSHVGLATIARRRGRPDDAEAWLDGAWMTARGRQAPAMRAMVLAAQGYTADQCGDGERALRRQVDGLAISVEHGMPRAIANALEGVAGALALSSDDEEQVRAARHLGLADAIRRRTGGPMPAGERFDVDRAESRCRTFLGDDAFDAAFAVGAGADVDDVVDEVLRAHVASD